MALRLVKLNFSLIKNSSKLEDIKGLYFVYLVIVTVSMLTDAGILIGGFTFIFSSGLIFSFLHNTRSAYTPPLSLAKDYNNNLTILENSLPVGRKNFIKGRILYTLVTALISLILLIPSFVSVFVINYRTSVDISPSIAIKFALGYFLFLVWCVLLGELRQISNGRTSEENKRINKITLWILIPLIAIRPFIDQYIPRFNSNLDFNLNLKLIPIAISIVLILVLLIQIIIIFKRINRLDFHQ